MTIRELLFGRRRAASPGTSALFAAPEYDDLSRMLSKAVRGAVREWTSQPRSEAYETTKCRSLLADSANAAATERLIVVFAGHGVSDALVGEVNSKRIVLFCCLGDLPADRDVGIVAYCCSAGTGLGASVSYRRPGNAFIGFKDQIAFVLGHMESEQAYARALSNCVREASGRGWITNQVLQSFRDALLREHRKAAPRSDAASRWLAMTCADHAESVCLLAQGGGPPSPSQS